MPVWWGVKVRVNQIKKKKFCLFSIDNRNWQQLHIATHLKAWLTFSRGLGTLATAAAVASGLKTGRLHFVLDHLAVEIGLLLNFELETLFDPLRVVHQPLGRFYLWAVWLGNGVRWLGCLTWYSLLTSLILVFGLLHHNSHNFVAICFVCSYRQEEKVLKFNSRKFQLTIWDYMEC